MSVVAAIGVALIIWSIGLGLFFASVVRRRGAPTRLAWRAFVRRPTLWIGLTLVVATINPLAAGALIVVFVVVVIVAIARRAPRRSP